jgi:hypothetical protein
VANLSKAVEANLKNSPELIDLKKSDARFKHAHERVLLAGEVAQDQPGRAKVHLTEAEKLYYQVADDPNLPAKPRAESASHAMAIADQLGRPTNEVLYHANKTEELATQAKKDGLGFSGGAKYVGSVVARHPKAILFSFGLSLIPSYFLHKSYEEDKQKLHQDIEDLHHHVDSVRKKHGDRKP